MNFPQLFSEVRGLGLMLGLVMEKNAEAFLQGCFDRGLLLNITAKNVLRFLPPLIISKSEIDECLAILNAVAACQIILKKVDFG